MHISIVGLLTSTLLLLLQLWSCTSTHVISTSLFSTN